MPRFQIFNHDEAQRRAKLARIPVDVVQPIVDQELVDRPIMVEYGETKSLDLCDITTIVKRGVRREDDVHAVRVVFNTRHPWVTGFMLSPRTSAKARAGIEVTVMTVLGVHGEMDGTATAEDRLAYGRLQHQMSERLYTATNILCAFDKRTGQNLLGEYEGEDEIDFAATEV